MFSDAFLDGQLASSFHKVAKAHAGRTQIGAQIAGQAEPHLAVLQFLQPPQDAGYHHTRRDLLRIVIENLPHWAGRNACAALHAQQELVLDCESLHGVGQRSFS
jgi:hypothetical protein